MNNKKIGLLIVTTIIGVLDAGYLSYIKIFHEPIYCTPGLGDCVSVNNSQYAELMGIPIAVLGLITYLLMLFLLLFGEKIKVLKPYALVLLFGISLFSFLFSMYLTYLEFFVIHAICQWCILNAICVTVIFIATIVRLKDRHLQPN